MCGLDSDGDGFPDVGLECDQPRCVQVAIKHVKKEKSIIVL